MTSLTIDYITQCVGLYTPAPYEIRETTREAAVAAILRRNGSDTEALFILRATKEGDPWSGHMAFPGGHREQRDESLRHTAERETREEIGLDLVRYGRYLGQIEPVKANPRGRDLDMVVSPFVYLLLDDDAPMTPNYEVADILWGSLNDMYTGDSFTHDQFEVGGEAVTFPGYSVGEHVVWGLTLRMLDEFFAAVDPNWQSRY